MKKPWLAFLLSALCAGAGLVYLGKVGWAILNFFGVILLGIVLLALVPSDAYQAVGIGLCVGSGALAMGMAQSMNAKLRLPTTPPAAAAGGPQPRAAAAPPVGGMRARFCSECGAQVGDSKFCTDCGQRQRPRDECAGCGAKLAAGSRFCAECGLQTV